MLRRREGGFTCVLLVIMALMALSMPTSALIGGKEGEGEFAMMCAAPLCISEVMPNPEGTDSDPWPDGEWVELIATDAVDDLTGWVLIDSSGRSTEIHGKAFTSENGIEETVQTIEQGGVVIFSASDVSAWSMKNTNGNVSLQAPNGSVVDESHWTTQQSGASLVRSNSEADPWIESTVATPGTNGGRFLTTGACIVAVCLNEMMVDPKGTDGRTWPDGEWIEMTGGGGEQVNWSDWGILHKGTYHLIDNMIVNELSNESLVLLDWGGSENTAALTNTQDQIALLDADMNAIHVLQWNESREGESLAYDRMSGEWGYAVVPTPGISGLEPEDIGRKSDVFFSRVMPAQSGGISGEWWEIENREMQEVQLFGWKLKFTRPSGGADEGVIRKMLGIEGGERLTLGTEPLGLVGFGGPEIVDINIVMNSAPTLTDSGGMLELFDPQGRLIDVIAYGEVSPTSEGWVGEPVPVPSTSTSGLIWLRGDGCKGGADTNTSLDWMLGWRRLGGSFFCESIHAEGGFDVIPMVSPGPEALTQLIGWLDGATASIDVQMYEFMSVHIAQALLRANLRGVNVTLLLEDSPLDETADLDMMHGFARLLAESGVDVRLIGSDENGDVQSPYRFLHAKIAVRDGSSLWIGSGNWKDSSFPIGDASGNRERGVFVHHQQFAEEVLARMESDADVSQHHIRKWTIDDASFKAIDGWMMPEVEALPPEHTLSIPPTMQAQKADFFTCPDECVEGIIGLIEEAEDSLDLSVQGLSGEWEEEWGPNPMIAAIEDAAERGVRIRLLHNGYYMNADVAAMIQRFNMEWNKTSGYDTSAILMNVNSSTVKLHDKTMLIDGEVAVLGSLNFVPSAFLRNREHMIVLRSAGLAEWLGGTFEDDWYRFDNQTDSDGDGLGDGWEVQNGFDRFSPNSTDGPDQNRDHDGDGLDAIDEQRWGGDPHDADTDRDCIRDDVEVMWAFRDGVDVTLAVSTVDADSDGILDNATVSCDGSPIVQQQFPVEETTGSNTTSEGMTEVDAVDDTANGVAISVTLIAGVMVVVLVGGIGISILKMNRDEE